MKHKDKSSTVLLNILIKYNNEIAKAKESKYKINLYVLANKIITENNQVTKQHLFDALGITRQAFNEWAKQKSERPKVDSDAEVMILEIYHRHHGKIGQKTIKNEILKETGWVISLNKIQRIMQINNIHGEYRSKKLYSKESKRNEYHADDLIRQDFKANKPNEKWFTDYCQVKTDKGTIYLMVIIDSYDNRIVHWGYRLLSNKNNENDKLSEHSSKILNQAFIKFHSSNTIVHTDHGAEFFNDKFKNIVYKYYAHHSAGRPGKSLDNRPIEYFWSILRGKVLVTKRKQKIALPFEETISKITKYLNFTYNTSIQEVLKWKSPYEFYNNYCINLEELSKQNDLYKYIKKATFAYHNETYGFDTSWDSEDDESEQDL